jgi:glutathione S-transferase
MNSTVTTPHSLQIRRHIRAPREKVFAAFRSLEAMNLWLGCMPDCIQEGEVDFRPGGHYRMRMRGPSEENTAVLQDYKLRGTYQEIDPPRKLSFTWTWEDDPDWIGVESLVTVELEESAGGTDLRLTHSGIPNEISRGKHAHGWEISMERLAEAVA